MEHTSYDFAGVVYLVALWDRAYQQGMGVPVGNA